MSTEHERRFFVAQALASIRLEGGTPDDDLIQWLEEYALGVIDTDEIRRRILQPYEDESNSSPHHS